MNLGIYISSKQLASMPVAHRQLYYRMKILELTPPNSSHDAFMLNFYQRLLDQPEDLHSLQQLDQRLATPGAG